MTATVVTLIARRLLVAVPILLVVSVLLFCVLRVLPVDPRRCRCRRTRPSPKSRPSAAKMGLDRPLPEQYAIWLARACTAISAAPSISAASAANLVAETLPATIELAVAAMLIAAVLGLRRRPAAVPPARHGLEPLADLGSIAADVDPGIPLGAVLHFRVRRRAARAAVHRRGSRPACRLPHITGFLLLDTLARRAPRRFLERAAST